MDFICQEHQQQGTLESNAWRWMVMSGSLCGPVSFNAEAPDLSRASVLASSRCGIAYKRPIPTQQPLKHALESKTSQQLYLPPLKRQKLNTPSPSASAWPQTEEPPRTSTSRKRNRCRVRIHPDTTFHEPSAAYDELWETSKPNLWYTQEDFSSTLLTMRKAIQSAHGPNRNTATAESEHQDESMELIANSLPLYGESLASIYLACCTDSASPETGLPNTITPVQLAQLGAKGDHCRGMETCALPDLAAERSLKRKEIIQNVVLFHKTLAIMEQPSECLRSISEQLTAPSRKFAQAMGLSDTLSALKMYADDCDAAPSAWATQRQSAAKGA